MIILHKRVFLKSIQKIVHATTFCAVDQKHQGIIATTLTEDRLQTLAVVDLVFEMTPQPLFQRMRGPVHFQW